MENRDQPSLGTQRGMVTKKLGVTRSARQRSFAVYLPGHTASFVDIEFGAQCYFIPGAHFERVVLDHRRLRLRRACLLWATHPGRAENRANGSSQYKGEASRGRYCCIGEWLAGTPDVGLGGRAYQSFDRLFIGIVEGKSGCFSARGGQFLAQSLYAVGV